MPGRVHVQKAAVQRGHADEVARVLEQVAIPGLAVPDRLLRPLSLAHVPRIEADADDRATLVHDRHMGGFVPALDTVLPPEEPLGASNLAAQGGPKAVGALGNQVVDPMAFGHLTAENARGPFPGGGVHRQNGSVPVQQHEGLQAGVEDRPQVGFRPPQRLLGARLLGPGLDSGERGLDCGADPGQIVLEEVVGGAGLHASDGRLLVDGAGHDQEGHRGRPFAGDRERCHAVEARQRVVGEDQVRPELVERLDEPVPGVDAA